MDRHDPPNLKVRNKRVNKAAWSPLSRLLMYTQVVGFILSKTERRDHCRLVHNTKYRIVGKVMNGLGNLGTDVSKRGPGPMHQNG